jgi:hypothetical protein
VFIGASAMRVVAFPLLFLAMSNTTNVLLIGTYAMTLAFLANGSYGPLLIFLNERFPTQLRATGTGLSWNIGYAIGGMMPFFVSLAASRSQELPKILAIFSCAVSVIFLIGGLIIPETRDNLDQLETAFDDG